MPNLLSELSYCSLLSYPTRPTTEIQQRAKDVSFDLKQGRRYKTCSIQELVARRVLERKDTAEFIGFFGPDVLAIPVPSSSLKRPGSLWIPQDLAKALRELDLVGDVLPIAERTIALPKSAFSQASERSKAIDHFNSIQVKRQLIAPASILLVDDVVTRGATLLGVASRVVEAYPDIPVRAFAAIRAITDAAEFRELVSPCKGRVSLNGDQTRRRP